MINDPIASRQRLFLEKTHTRSAPERASPSGPHSSRTARAQTVRPCSFWRSDALSDQKVRPTIFAPESSLGGDEHRLAAVVYLRGSRCHESICGVVALLGSTPRHLP